MLNYDPSSLEMSLKLRVLNSSGSVDYENFFLHFREDTEFIVALSKVYLASWTSLRGVPWVFGWTVSPSHAGFGVYTGAPWNIYPWEYSASGGAAFVASFERFDAIDVTIGAQAVNGGFMVVEYISSYAAPSRREASALCSSCWSRLPLLEDTTYNLSYVGTGRIRWKPPLDWKIATLNDGTGRSYGGGQFFGNPLVSKGGVVYAIRIRWVSTTPGKGPLLNNLAQRMWIVFTKPDGTRQGNEKNYSFKCIEALMKASIFLASVHSRPRLGPDQRQRWRWIRRRRRVLVVGQYESHCENEARSAGLHSRTNVESAEQWLPRECVVSTRRSLLGGLHGCQLEELRSPRGLQ